MKKVILDSTQPFIATGQIGEAWAVVVLEEIAKGNLEGYVDILYLQEVLDRYYYIKEGFEGRKIFNSFKNIATDVFLVTPEDFDLSYKLYKNNKEVSPRDLIHAAVAINNNIAEIFSTDGPGFDNIKEVKRVKLPNLLEELNLKNNYIYERKNISRS
jgi:predicted nucleic acid-binding protein